ncbi:hypothetical protein [Streptacidiphilus sp. P02-A3a]|uniref:hypothetical protein n=1 Tax=Streptacidiphilus sp. P02-A3a TaxID=2704468 RepID=UPI0015FA96F4|nr:hypothetical protein [Streptacidiphilus sp. P02-A3a]QMU70080.1 hypothetical protein GXP74_19455 [Streptacidiphilus sp. P02-A3a]QMU70467.1 hypothetical protein GXP74_21905 [Streptacidiphilus sp. P02-A3a]
MGTPRVAAALLAVLVGCAAPAGCSAPAGTAPGPGRYRRVPVPGGAVYYRARDRTLHVLSCGAEFRLDQSAHQVTLAAAAYAFAPGAASCRAYDFTLALRAPLGGRRVVDATTGARLPVRDWAQFPADAPQTPAPTLPAGG